HTNDYLAFAPIFHGEELVAFSGLMVHHMDVGGMNMATRGWGREIYQEGLRIPPLKIVKQGVLDEDLLGVILNNTRTPEVLDNDMRAQIASVQVALGELQDMTERHRLAQMARCFGDRIAYVEQPTREQMRVT